LPEDIHRYSDEAGQTNTTCSPDLPKDDGSRRGVAARIEALLLRFACPRRPYAAASAPTARTRTRSRYMPTLRKVVDLGYYPGGDESPHLWPAFYWQRRLAISMDHLLDRGA
jgi:hypothetical protein